MDDDFGSVDDILGDAFKFSRSSDEELFGISPPTAAVLSSTSPTDGEEENNSTSAAEVVVEVDESLFAARPCAGLDDFDDPFTPKGVKAVPDVFAGEPEAPLVVPPEGVLAAAAVQHAPEDPVAEVAAAELPADLLPSDSVAAAAAVAEDEGVKPKPIPPPVVPEPADLPLPVAVAEAEAEEVEPAAVEAGPCSVPEVSSSSSSQSGPSGGAATASSSTPTQRFTPADANDFSAAASDAGPVPEDDVHHVPDAGVLPHDQAAGASEDAAQHSVCKMEGGVSSAGSSKSEMSLSTEGGEINPGGVSSSSASAASASEEPAPAEAAVALDDARAPPEPDRAVSGEDAKPLTKVESLQEVVIDRIDSAPSAVFEEDALHSDVVAPPSKEEDVLHSDVVAPPSKEEDVLHSDVVAPPSKAPEISSAAATPPTSAAAASTAAPTSSSSSAGSSSSSSSTSTSASSENIYHKFFEEDDAYMANVRKDLRRDQLTVEQVFGDTQNLYNEAVTAAVLSSTTRTDFTGHLSAAIGQAQNRVASASPSDHSHPSTPGRSSHSTQSYTQSAAGYLTSPKILRYYNRLRREDSASGADEKTLGLIMAEGRKEPAAFLSQLATARDHLGQTLLHLAAEYESPNAFKLIAWLAKDVAVPIDAMDFQQQRTALMRAVVGKKTQTVKILLDCGASFTKRDGLGVTPAIYAAQENVKEVLWILVNRDEGVLYQTDVNFCNCIHWACSKGHTGIVRYLSDLKADFGHVDESGNTPLLRAIQAEELGIAQLLLERKLGSVNDKNKDGLDAFGMAATRSAVANKQFIDMYDHMQATAIDDANADAAESDDDGPGSPGGGEDHDDSNTQSLPGVGDTTKTNTSSLANMNGVRQRMRARGKKIFSTVRSLIRFRLPKKGRFGLMFKNVQYARRFFRQVFVPHAGPCVVLFLLFLTILLRRKILCPRGEADNFSHGNGALLQHTSDATPTSAAWLNVNSGQTSPESSADIPTVDPLNAGFELAPSLFSRVLHSFRSAFAFASLLAAVLSLFECGIGVFFVLSLFADPGNHPKAADGRQALLRHFRELDSAKLLESHDPKTTKASVSKNFRYCDACHIEKGSRVEHCQSSNFCVTEYDHYSPWVNNAVGRGNHRFYLLWLLSIAGQCGVCTLAYGKCFFGELLGLGSSSRGGSTSTSRSSGSAADGELQTLTPSSDASRAGITRRPPADIASPASANGNYELNLNLDDSAPQTFCGEVLYLSLLAAAVVAHGLLFLWAWKLLKKQARLIGQNLTCNESDNRIRYEHFWVKKDLEGGGKIEFVNPYDLGSRKANWVAFWKGERSSKAGGIVGGKRRVL